jgi:membrane-bound metal-dependent hydrolase YbcI (DUF457 family)
VNKHDHVLNGALLSLGIGSLVGLLAVDVAALGTAGPAALVDAGVTVATEVVRVGVPVTLGALFPDVDTAFGRHRKTFHNLPVLAVFVAFPFVFGNLAFVWVGVATHYVLDLVGSARGIALLYPLSPTEYDLPGGVPVSSRWATPLTVVISGLEVGALALVHYYVVPLDATLAVTTRLLAAVV